MEKVFLYNLQLDHLATADATLKPYFYGTVTYDQLPHQPIRKELQGYIVNTDPNDSPGRHWLAHWTHSGNVCEVMDSYALPLKSSNTTKPLQDWLKSH